MGDRAGPLSNGVRVEGAGPPQRGTGVRAEAGSQ